MEELSKLCENKRMAADDAMRLNFIKKRKLNCELETEDSAAVEFTTNEVSPAESWTSGSDKHDGGRKSSRSPDLEDVILQLFDGSGTEISISGDDFLRECTPTNEVCEDSEQTILTADASSTSPPPPPGRKISSSASPPATELEEYFAAAETHLQKRFAKKYNYDIVKDIPMEGRFLWVRLHP